MARPQSVSDDQILDATHEVLVLRGPQGLTISEVAREVGLSRAAITLRFTNADHLKRLSLERAARSFEDMLADQQVPDGAPGLLRIAEMLGEMIKGRERFSGFMFRYGVNINDPAMVAFEERRGAALRGLLASVMPETSIPRAAAVDAFMAQMTGSMLNWLAGSDPSAARFLRERALNWIRLAGIPIDEAAA